MALATDLVEDWADGTYRFALPIRQLEELDEKTGGGPLAVLTRLFDGTWRLPDVRDTIRLALIGGGVPAVDALKLVRRYVDDAPLETAVPLAAQILATALRGRTTVASDPGNGMAATSASDPAPIGSTSPLSDGMPLSSASASPTSAA